MARAERLMALNAAQNDGGGGRRGGAAGIPGGGGSGFRGQGGGGAQSGLGDSGCATASCLPFFRFCAFVSLFALCPNGLPALAHVVWAWLRVGRLRIGIGPARSARTRTGPSARCAIGARRRGPRRSSSRHRPRYASQTSCADAGAADWCPCVPQHGGPPPPQGGQPPPPAGGPPGGLVEMPYTPGTHLHPLPDQPVQGPPGGHGSPGAKRQRT